MATVAAAACAALLPALAVAEPLTTRVMYLVDVSSGAGAAGGDCGNPSADGAVDTILECEIRAITGMNEGLLPYSPVDASLVTFSDNAQVQDVGPGPGIQAQTDVAADEDLNGVRDAVDPLYGATSGGGRDFDDVLSALQILACSCSTNQAVLFGTGDGTLSTGPGSPLQSLADFGVVVDTYAVGPVASCAPGEDLRVIADTTRGTCAEVPEPAALPTSPSWFTPTDSDRDGVPDHRDACDEQPGSAANGCPVPPDADGDGVPDASDACPSQAAPGTTNGCPVAQAAPSASPSTTPVVTPTPDRLAPQTRIVRVRVNRRTRRVTATFTSSEVGSRFRCRLDRGRWRACRSPRRLGRLARGDHILRVVAVDPAGNADPTASVKRFRVR